MKESETLKGSFTDDKGNSWEYCGGRCRLKQRSITDTTGRRVDVKCEPRKGAECTCSCVLFDMSGGGHPKLLDKDGNWVKKNPRADYSCRCVKKV